jgi:CBS domain containing-hemolysin-like protein
MQDILEEIVGKLHDEHDIVSVSEIKKQDDGSYLINAKMIIEDINDALDLNIPVENFETIAGYVYAMLERVPKIGDKIERDNYVIKVEKTFRQRILEVKLVKK